MFSLQLFALVCLSCGFIVECDLHDVEGRQSHQTISMVLMHHIMSDIRTFHCDCELNELKTAKMKVHEFDLGSWCLRHSHTRPSVDKIDPSNEYQNIGRYPCELCVCNGFFVGTILLMLKCCLRYASLLD